MLQWQEMYYVNIKVFTRLNLRIEQVAPKEAQVLENCEILVSYIHTKEK